MAKNKPQAPYLAEPNELDWAAGDAFLNSLDGPAGMGGGQSKKSDRPLMDLERGSVLNDWVTEGVNAMAGGVGSIANFISPGNPLSQKINQFVQESQSNLTDQARAGKEELEREIQQADGLGAEAKAALKYLVNNPGMAAAQAVGSFALPGGAVKAAGGVARMAGVGAQGVARAGLAGGAAAGAALSGGDAAGTAYDLVKKSGGSEEQAQSAARQASVIPAAVGAVGGMTGAEKLLAGAGKAGRSMAGRVAGTALAEGAQEGLEEGVTQYEGQRAAASFDPSIDPMKGVGAAATIGAALGAGTGGAVAAVTPGDHVRATKVPEGGPLSKAVNAGIEAQAQNIDAGQMPAALVPQDAAAKMQAADPVVLRQDALNRQLLDENVRQAIRTNLGDDALNEALYYANAAKAEGLPGKTADRLMQLAERIVSDSQLTPVTEIPQQAALPMADNPGAPQLEAPAEVPQIGIDTTPTGVIRVDGEGYAAPEVRADAISTRQAVQERESLGQQAPRAAATPAPEPAPAAPLAITMDTTPTGVMIAGQDGVAPETRTDALRRQDAARAQQVEAERKSAVGLTPDVERAQAARLASMQPGDIKAPSGSPFKNEHAAKRAQKKAAGSEVVPVDGGWVVRPAAQDVETVSPNVDAVMKELEIGVGTRMDKLRAKLGHAEDQLQRRTDTPHINKQDQAESLAEIRARIASLRAAEAAAAEADQRDLREDLGRSMLKGARAELDAAISSGELDAAQAKQIVSEAARTGDAAGASADIVEAIDAAAGAKRLSAVAGDKIDDEWTAFKPESGTLAIPRAEMPQVKAEHRGAMTNFLNARGIEHEHDEVPAGSLKPTQAEFAPAKVDKARDFTGGDRSILVSEDGHVADGHHQWLAKLDKDEPVKVIRLKAPIKDLLEQMKAFPSSELSEGAGSPRVIGRVGRTPNSAQDVELRPNKDGTITPHIEGYGVLDFDSGDPLKLASDVSDTDAIEAVKKSGSLGKGAKFYEAKPKPDGAAFRRGAARETDAVVDAIREQVAKLTSAWANAPDVVVLASFDDAPAAVKRRNQALLEAGASGVPDAFVAGGKVYLLADRIDSKGDIERLLFHEVLGHAGLRGAFGSELDPILDQMWRARRREVMAKAKEYGLDTSAEKGRREAAEEVLAEWAESQPSLGFVRRAVATIRAWLRKHAPGLKGMKLSDDEIISQFLLPAQGFIKRGPAQAELDFAPVFDRGDEGAKFARSAAADSARDVPAAEARTSRWSAEEPSRLDNLLYAIQDKHIDTRRVLQAVTKQIGAIKDRINPYLQEELYHGRAANLTEEFLRKEVKPLLQAMSNAGVSMADFEKFLHARHAQERNEQIAKINPEMPDGGSGMKTAEAQAYLAGLPAEQRTAMEGLAAKVDKITEGTRQYLVDTGLESKETVDKLRETYKHYVPLQRGDAGGGSAAGTGQGFSVRGSSTKRAMGSDKEVTDILANLIMQRERAITRGEKNKVAQAVYGLAVKAPNKEFWLPINPGAQAKGEKGATSLFNALSAMGLDIADAASIAREPTQRYVDPKTGLVNERVNPGLRSRDNVLGLRINGEDHFVIFNADNERAARMATALKNLDAPQLGQLMGLSARITRYFASVNTQYNPVFGIINLMRDSQSAMVNLSSTKLAGKQKDVASHILPIVKDMAKMLRARRAGKEFSSDWTKVIEEFEAAGGKTGYRDNFNTATERADALRKELEAAGDNLSARQKLMKTLRYVGGVLTDYNDTLENSVRVAAFKVARDQGLSPEQAASLAKNLTVNFNRKGSLSTQAGSLYAFFNAAVQGTARLTETMTGPAGKRILKAGLLLGVAQAALLAQAGFDDDDPPEFVKERAFIIPTGDGKYISIPMPLGLHVIPNFGRIATEWALGDFKDTGKRVADFAGVMADAFNPIGNAGMSVQTLTPTVLDPLVALSENKDFAGRPIAREDFNSMHPTPGHTRAKETATPPARLLSQAINWFTGGSEYRRGVISPTPDQIDYLIGEGTGGIGREISKVWQTGRAELTGEELPTYKIPLVGRLIGDTQEQSAQSSKFYNNIRTINEHKAEVDGRREKGEDVTDYLAENPEAQLTNLAKVTEKRVSNLRKLRRKLLEDGAPADQVQGVEKRIANEMKRLNERVSVVRKGE